jgi:oligosaccharide repeat unit polymerase
MSKGIRENIIVITVLFFSYIYIIQTPTIYWLMGQFEIVNVSVEHYFNYGMVLVCIWLMCYQIGFSILGSRVAAREIENISDTTILKINRSNFIVFCFIIFIIFTNSLVGGVNFIDIVLGVYGKPTLGLQGFSYYFQNTADSLITVILIFYYFRFESKKLIILTVVSFALFMLLGFRYRIILTIFGLMIIYILHNKINIKSMLKILFAVIVFLFLLLNMTYNRTAIFMQNFDEVKLVVSDLPFDAITDQAKGSLVDFSIYQAVDKSEIAHDYGETWFYFSLVKMLPSFLFEQGIKPYPPPLLVAIDIATGGSRDIGEAVTIIGAMYFSFGILGVIFFSLIFGLISKFFQNMMGRSSLGDLLAIIFLLSFFQLLTRGYLPQFIDHFAYMLFPILLQYRLLSKLPIIR